MRLLSAILVLHATILVADDPARTSPKQDAVVAPCCRAPLPAGKPTDRSLYQLESTWISDVGRDVKLSVLRGRPQVLAMFFSNCEYACPIVVNDMKRLEAALPKDVLAQTDFLLVSFDTRRDTPDALAAYRRKENLPRERWTLLHGENDDVRELAALLGINYAADARGQFAHSNIITVLNAEGEIAFQQNGLSQPAGPLIDAVTKAGAGARR